jgi:hypothetical protein
MPGHGAKLERKQEQAIAALLAEPTIEAAARKAKVAHATLKGWLKQPAFEAAYAEARRQVLERTVARLLASTIKAVEALDRNLDADRPGDQIRAAVAVLEHAAKGVELLDLAGQVGDLRHQVEELQRDDGDPATAAQRPEKEAGAGPRDGLQAAPNDPPPPVPERELGGVAPDGGRGPAPGIAAGAGGDRPPDPGVPSAASA